jgi:hypothetical protein
MQVPKIPFRAFFQLPICFEGDIVVLGAEPVDQVWCEELHGFFLALRRSVS